MDLIKYLGGNYLRKEDMDYKGRNLCISGVTEENVGDEYKPVVQWAQDVKPMVLNKTNLRILMQMYGANTTGWANQLVNVFNDPSVSFNGAHGGLRVRPPVQAAQPVTGNSPLTTFQDADIGF